MRLVLYAVMFDGNPHINRQLGGKIISCLWLHCPGSRKIASKLASRCERISEINTGICIDDNTGNYHLLPNTLVTSNLNIIDFYTDQAPTYNYAFASIENETNSSTSSTSLIWVAVLEA